MNAKRSKLVLFLLFLLILFVSPVLGDEQPIQQAGLAGVWDMSDIEQVNSEYLHFYQSGTFVYETNYYPNENGNDVSLIVFGYGTYTFDDDSINFSINFFRDINGKVIPLESIDYCWIYSPFFSEVNIYGLYYKDDASMTTAELHGRPGGGVNVTPNFLPDCPADITNFTEDITWGKKWSDNPEDFVFKKEKISMPWIPLLLLDE